MVAMDANFRLRSRLRGINKDPEMGLGWAYFMNNGPYSEFIKDYVDLEEVCARDKLPIDNINSFCRLVPASGFWHSSICLPRGQKVYWQLAWPQ
jgi:hypothetical protein